MLELILKLLEHLGALLKLRDASNRTAFVDHIEPIYRDIKVVYDDYTAVFKATNTSLLDEKVSLDSIIKALKSKRSVNERLRQELVSYSHTFRTSGRFPEEFSTFCFYASSIILSEPTDVEMPLGRHATQMGSFVEFLEHCRNERRQRWPSQEFPTESSFREFVAGCLQATLNHMAGNWELVMKSYFDLRVKHLKPA